MRDATVRRDVDSCARTSLTRSPSVVERLQRKALRSLVKLQGQEVLAILGMHRSGTSSLAGSLEQAGLFLGDRDVAGQGKWNAKGNRESKVLMRLHEDVLKASGGAWDRPPERVTWSPEQRHIRDRFIASRAMQRSWGFKDPRTLLVIDGWLEAIPDLRMVATIRHPSTVAQSLQRRSGPQRAGSGTLDGWLQLWLAYNERLLRLHEAHGFPIIDFDLPAEPYQQRLAAITTELGLHPGSEGPEFFESSLRTSDRHDGELPEAVEEVYRRLVEIAATQADGQPIR